MKKLGTMILTGAILMTPSFAAFSDVSPNHWAYSAISKMEQASILSGYEDGTFKPSNNITLAEFAAIFTKIFEIPQDNISNYFTDIPMGHWAKGYAEAVREYINPLYDSVGEAIGVTDYSYLKGLPSDIEMTREAFIYAISRIYGYDESLYSLGEEKVLFGDYEEILYPKEVVLAYKNKVISGEVIDGVTYIRPNRCITRAEASAIFRNLLKYEEKRVTNKGYAPELSASFSDIIGKLKNEGVTSVKSYIYDTQGVLNNEKFSLTDNELNSLNDISNMFFDDFSYEVIEKDFYSFNRGYIKVKTKGYDIFDRVRAIDIENINIEEFCDGLKKEILDKRIKVVEKEEIFNFAKKDGEWKLILK